MIFSLMDGGILETTFIRKRGIIEQIWPVSDSNSLVISAETKYSLIFESIGWPCFEAESVRSARTATSGTRAFSTIFSSSQWV
ncbi:MAG: hypothetical protein ACYSSO_02630 [Planctomycetota bacterium]